MSAALQPTQAQILAASKIYCDRVNDRAKSDEVKMTFSEGEDKRVRLIAGGIPKDDDIQIWIENGRLRSSDPEFAAMVFAAILKDLAAHENSEGNPEGQEHKKQGKNLPARPQDVKQGESFDMGDWRSKQAKTYNVAGKTAPNAFALSEESNKRGLCTQIIDAGRTENLVWGHVRVTDPKTGQYREDRVSHEKGIFTLLKSWEDANAQARFQKPGQPTLLIGVDEATNLPRLNPDVKIKNLPAPLWLTMQVMRSWSMADRDAITKAERRAQLKILNREWRDEGEISLETEEEQSVRESIERQRG
jgi:hypothetical protein